MIKEKVAMKYQFDLMRVATNQTLKLKGGKSWRKPVYHKKKEAHQPGKYGGIGKKNFADECRILGLQIGVALVWTLASMNMLPWSPMALVSL
jgi:hypothetical protein